MRRFLVTIGLTGLLLMCATDASAQRAFSSKELTERINALRNRLQDHQQKTIRQVVDKTPLDAETIEVNCDKAFVELENSKNAAVTVLFHDSEAPVSHNATSVFASVASSQESGKPVLSNEQAMREEKFAALRLKVQQATRRTHDAAQQIGNMVAKVP